MPLDTKDANSHGSEEYDIAKNEVSSLLDEADMPLEEVMRKYQQPQKFSGEEEDVKEATEAKGLSNLFSNLSLVKPQKAAAEPIPPAAGNQLPSVPKFNFQLPTPLPKEAAPASISFNFNFGGLKPPEAQEEEEEEEEDDSSESDEDYEEAEAEVEEVKDTRHIPEILTEVFAKLSARGIPILEPASFKYGKKVGEGGNGVVCLGKATVDDKEIDVAIKTISVKGRDDILSAVEEIELEGRISYLAGTNERSGVKSRLCCTLGAAYESKKIMLKGRKRDVVKLHLVMSRIAALGDLHDAVIHGDSSWKALRESGKDTGARAGKYGKVDDDATQDAWTYTVTTARKLHLAEEIFHSLQEMKGLGLLHLDIKPSNLLCNKSDKLTLIDFGEGFEVKDLGEDNDLGYTCGTPGYMAPEVRDDGAAHYASDIYSAGVTLLELWVGHLWEDGVEDEELAMERATAMKKLMAGEPKVASLVQRCLSEEPEDRPTAKQVIKNIQELKGQLGVGAGFGHSKAPPGRGGKKGGKKAGRVRRKARGGKGKMKGKAKKPAAA